MAVEWATVAEESGAAMVAVATDRAMAEEEEAEVEVAEMASRRAAVVATVVVAEVWRRWRVRPRHTLLIGPCARSSIDPHAKMAAGWRLRVERLADSTPCLELAYVLCFGRAVRPRMQ